MEEQADTKRTETERASHIQHTETVQGESSRGTTLGDISLLDRSMYYWAPSIQAPIEQHISFNASRPSIFSPPDASHISMLAYLQCKFPGLKQSTCMDLPYLRGYLLCRS